MKTKTFLLLALAAVFALPATASAEDIPLHLNPTPAGAQTVTGGLSKFSTTNGTTVECSDVSGSATFNAGGTTGTMQLLFTGDCKSSGFTCNSSGLTGGTITTSVLPFELVTLPSEKPGVVVKAPSGGVFASFTCAAIISVTVTADNGVIGTIENECGETSNEAKINFHATAHGVQEHKTVAGTTAEYTLTKGTEKAAQDTTGTVHLTQASELVCT